MQLGLSCLLFSFDQGLDTQHFQSHSKCSSNPEWNWVIMFHASTHLSNKQFCFFLLWEKTKTQRAWRDRMPPYHDTYSFSCMIRCVFGLDYNSVINILCHYVLPCNQLILEVGRFACCSILQSYRLIILQTILSDCIATLILSDCIASVIWNQNPSQLVHVKLVNKVWAAQDEKHPRNCSKRNSYN